MKQYGLEQQELETILSILHQFPEIDEALLFGSRAMGRERRGSDVDIALKGKNLDPIVSKVSYKLNQETFLPYYFDILNYNSIDNLELKSHIDRVGIIIHSKS